MELSRRGFIGGTLAAATVTKALAAEPAPAYDLKDYKTGALGKIVGDLPPGRYDSHVHVYPGEADPQKLVNSFREAGLTGGCIFSERPIKWEESWPDPLPPAEAMDRAIEWASGSPTIYPFYWIDPARPDAVDLVDMAVEKGIYGFKVIRGDGRPVDEKALPVYARIAKHNRPLTFHSGILWDGRASSDNFRPANWEGLLAVPGLRFALAHISWPWCDECIAVYGKLLNAILKHGDKVPEMFIDTTPGTPKIYRRDALTRLFTVGYDIFDHIQFGSDCRTQRYSATWTKDWFATDDTIFAELGLDGRQVDSVYRGSLKRYLFGGDNTKRKIPTPDGTGKR